MKNLAGDKDCDAEIITELGAAGIFLKQIERENREVPASVIGSFGCWEFRRAWYYWIATAPYGRGIPTHVARILNGIWEDVIRIGGFAGGVSVDEPSFISAANTIDTYHIDSQEGLNAFAGLLRALTRKPTKVE
jgi:hypothetical protein